MNQGVEILLARMDSHPEEFAFQFANEWPEESRWASVMGAVCRRVHNDETVPSQDAHYTFLTDEEVRALYDKYTSIQGDAFTRRVMKTLFEDKDDGSIKLGADDADLVRLLTSVNPPWATSPTDTPENEEVE